MIEATKRRVGPRTEREKPKDIERNRLEKALEIGLEESFPASDAVAVIEPAPRNKDEICDAADMLTVREAFDAVRVFLELCWQRQDRPVEEIAFILGGTKWADGSPVDPTLWEDWLVAVGKCRSVAEGDSNI
jgi:hypothetical protein